MVAVVTVLLLRSDVEEKGRLLLLLLLLLLLRAANARWGYGGAAGGGLAALNGRAKGKVGSPGGWLPGRGLTSRRSTACEGTLRWCRMGLWVGEARG